MLAKKPSRYLGTITTVVLSITIFVFAGWLLLNRQYAADQVSVWAYNPPAEVQAIEDRVDFTDKGKFYFYATQPVIANAESFNESCPRQETGNPIIGCYAMGRIYVYNITNQQLDGIEEVTAAHEMLHAVWERMSTKDQEKVGKLLEEAYAKVGNAELKGRMDYYARTEPGQFHNELHSIFGTEVPNLGDDLEDYYAQYFNDRQAVLAYNEQYSSVFKGLAAQAETLASELGTLAASIGGRTEAFNAESAQLSADIQAFNDRAAANDFQSQAEFNRERAALVARTNQLDNERQAINADIVTYNEKYDQYVAVATQIELLNKSIDSIKALEPTPSL
ncbi:MAG: hypothetical protein WAV04_03775 [Candidatus Microsaccharimonas sp.]